MTISEANLTNNKTHDTQTQKPWWVIWWVSPNKRLSFSRFLVLRNTFETYHAAFGIYFHIILRTTHRSIVEKVRFENLWWEHSYKRVKYRKRCVLYVATSSSGLGENLLILLCLNVHMHLQVGTGGHGGSAQASSSKWQSNLSGHRTSSHGSLHLHSGQPSFVRANPCGQNMRQVCAPQGFGSASTKPKIMLLLFLFDCFSIN